MHPTVDMTQKNCPVLPYPRTTMYGAVAYAGNTFPNRTALIFMGKKTSFRTLLQQIEAAARGFAALGIRRNDAVTICMPNVPQAVIALYALNRLGAVANMVHPLSAEGEITFYLSHSESKAIVTLDLFAKKVVAARDAVSPDITVICARMQDALPAIAIPFYTLSAGKKFLDQPQGENTMTWRSLNKNGKGQPLPEEIYDEEHTSVLLYSGGTTGTPKGICLSDFNFNALGMQIREIAGCDFSEGFRFLSVMPVFHGFGLGIGIHTVLENGATCILVPRFTPETYAQLVKKNKPNFIAGVPTIYSKMIHNENMKGADLSYLKGVFSGGDTLTIELKRNADAFLKEHGARVQIREGYGLTECVTASCVTPVDTYKEGSIGLPLRDMIYKIVEPGTFRELPAGEAGEIILTGPTLMLGYLKNEEETAKTIRRDENGTRWLFTGDMGRMDEEGYVYYVQRIKRMIITNGYNVYPMQVENLLETHPDVTMACVIGIPDEERGERIRAYIKLADKTKATEEEKKLLSDFCREKLSGFARPREFVFRDELPLTLVGKVAFHVLEEEAAKELAQAKAEASV